MQPAFSQDRDYRVLFNAFPDAVLIHPLLKRGFGRFIEVNRYACQFYGYSREEFMQRTIKDLVVPSDVWSRKAPKIKKQLLQKGRIVFEARHQAKDGRLLEVEIQSQIVELNGQNVIFSVCKDISHRRQEQAFIQQAKETAERYLNISAEIIVALDRFGTITMLNESGHKLLGYPQNALIGKNWFTTCLPPRIRNRIRKIFNELMSGNLQNVADYQNPVITKDGTERIVLWHNSLLKDENGKIIGTISSGKDITELRSTERALKESEARYRSLFENSPVALWEEDLTEMIDYLNHLLKTKVGDRNIRQFLTRHPQEIEELLKRIHVLRINQATVKLHEAQNPQQVIENLSRFFTEDFYEIFKDELQAIVDGKDDFTCEERIRTLSGKIKTIRLKFSLMRPQSNILSKYIGLIATMDITDLKKAQIEISRSHTRLEILHELDKAVLEARSVEDISNAALNKLQKIIAADRLSIIVLTEDSQKAVVFARGILEKPLGQAKVFPKKEVLPHYKSLGTKKLIDLEGAKDHGALNGIIQRLFKAGLKAIVNIPIIAHGELLGALNFAAKNVNTLSDQVIQTGEEIADILGIAIEQMRLHETIEQHALAVEDSLHELQQIHELSSALSGLQNIHKVAEESAKVFQKALSADVVFFYLKQNRSLELIAYRSHSKNTAQVPAINFKVGECLCGLAAQSGTSIFSQDIRKDQRCTRDECKNSGLHSYAAIPLIVRGKILGIIGLGSTSPRDFSIQKSFLETLANEAALGLQNAMLLEALRRYEGELERRIAQRTAELVEANKELEAFSYSVSHDLRAPLRAIDGFSRILAEDYADVLDAEAKRLIRVVRQNTRHMGQLIDDLLAFSRTSRQPLNPSNINMGGLAEAIFYELTDEQQRESVVFKIKSLPKITGDATLMRQVWHNLIGNALKFSHKREKPRIEIGAIERSDEVVYYVKDNGVGFDMKYAHKLFQIFQRLHTSQEFEGTGVGLSIVQRIIKRHNGRVWAKGKLDSGATFYFSLPK